MNKVASKVDLRFDLQNNQTLPSAAVVRLRRAVRHRLDEDGRVQVTSQRTRDQQRNLEDARDKLAELIRAALRAPKPRRPTKPSRGAKRRRLDAKRRLSEKKATRRSVRGED